MSRRITALLLALAMSGVLFATALAEEDTAEQSAQTAQAEAQSETTADNAATKALRRARREKRTLPPHWYRRQHKRTKRMRMCRICLLWQI